MIYLGQVVWDHADSLFPSLVEILCKTGFGISVLSVLIFIVIPNDLTVTHQIVMVWDPDCFMSSLIDYSSRMATTPNMSYNSPYCKKTQQGPLTGRVEALKHMWSQLTTYHQLFLDLLDVFETRELSSTAKISKLWIRNSEKKKEKAGLMFESWKFSQETESEVLDQRSGKRREWINNTGENSIVIPGQLDWGHSNFSEDFSNFSGDV